MVSSFLFYFDYIFLTGLILIFVTDTFKLFYAYNNTDIENSTSAIDNVTDDENISSDTSDNTSDSTLDNTATTKTSKSSLNSNIDYYNNFILHQFNDDKELTEKYQYGKIGNGFPEYLISNITDILNYSMITLNETLITPSFERDMFNVTEDKINLQWLNTSNGKDNTNNNIYISINH